MRAGLALLLWLFLATFAPRGGRTAERLPPVAVVRAQPVLLDPSWPERRELGGLRFLGAWSLTSNDPRFGGISAMHVEGRSVLAFSDSGWMIRFPLPEGGTRRAAAIAPLPEGPGSGRAKAQRDIESAWVEPRRAWIAFERSNVVWRYSRPDWREEASAAPAAMRRWPANRGSEAMVRLGDGRFLIFAEGRGRGGPALLFEGDPAAQGTPAAALFYQAPEGYRATDAATLPDGRVLVLNRRFSLLEGFTAKLAVLRKDRDGRLRAVEIADFRPPVTVDNMEALSVTRERGRTVVWIASDDNYMPLQRTLLMKFELK